jgi:hypothetical protein
VKANTILQFLQLAVAWLLEPFQAQIHALAGTRFAVVTTGKSIAITNADATPAVANSANLARGNVRRHQGLAAIASGDSAGSIYRVARVRSSDSIDSVKIWTADIGTTTAADIGFYDTAANGGAVVDVDSIASGVSLKDGALAGLDVTFEAGAAAGLYTNAEKRIWEALGLSADPQKDYDIALTLTGDADAAGTVLVRVYVVSGE